MQLMKLAKDHHPTAWLLGRWPQGTARPAAVGPAPQYVRGSAEGEQLQVRLQRHLGRAQLPAGDRWVLPGFERSAEGVLEPRQVLGVDRVRQQCWVAGDEIRQRGTQVPEGETGGRCGLEVGFDQPPEGLPAQQQLQPMKSSAIESSSRYQYWRW